MYENPGGSHGPPLPTPMIKHLYLQNSCTFTEMGRVHNADGMKMVDDFYVNRIFTMKRSLVIFNISKII